MSNQRIRARDLHKLFTPASGDELDALFREVVGESEDRNAPLLPDKPFFLQAAERRAQASGSSADELLEAYAKRLRESSYPTPDCLTPEDVQAVGEGTALPAGQAKHVAACEGCSNLLQRLHPSDDRSRAFLADVRQAREMAGTGIGASDVSLETAAYSVDLEKTHTR